MFFNKREKFFRLKINYESVEEPYLGGVADLCYGYDYTVRHVNFKRFTCYAIEFECRDKSLDFSLISEYLYDLIYIFGLIRDNDYWQFSTKKCCYYHNVAICAIDNSCILNVEKGRGILLWHCAKIFNRDSFESIDRHLVSFVNDLGLCSKITPLVI